LAADLLFIDAAHANMKAICGGKAIWAEEIDSQAAAWADEIGNIFAAATLTAFSQENVLVVEAFRKSDWATFADESQNCIYCLFSEFPEPALCANYCTLRLGAPIDLTGKTQVQTWNMFGSCCNRVGFKAGATLARKKLDSLGHASLADAW
jgi:hypothetical protein